jgi:drug/metabolite transporter (DMT)-like permease
MVNEFLKQAGLAFLFAILTAPLVWWLEKRLDHVTKQKNSLDFALLKQNVPNILRGFLFAILAAVVWGLANATTRYSAEPFKNAIFDISFIQFSGGALFIFLVSIIRRTPNQMSIQSNFLHSLKSWNLIASFVMAINTYAFALGVSKVPAGTIATLENMQVVWIALILTIIFSIKIPASWFFSSVVVLIGAAFVTKLEETLNSRQSDSVGYGYALGLVAGLAFAIYTLLWAKVRNDNRNFHFHERTLELSTMLAVSGLLLLPVHMSYCYFTNNAISMPFTNLPLKHIAIQFLIGITSLGLTYLLVNEAFESLANLGSVKAVVIGLGISYAVFFTLIFEFFIFGQTVSYQQWIGVVLFSLGFMMVWRDVNEKL